MDADPRELLALAVALAESAGALSLERLRDPRSDVRTKSTGTDMVTEVDEACERLIVDGIRAARPGDGILSEEGANAESASGVRWVIDPIDGTTNYLYGHPGYGISIAVEVDGEPVVGVGHRPDARRAVRRRRRRRRDPERRADPGLGRDRARAGAGRHRLRLFARGPPRAGADARGA